ncbi:HD domain-containing protein [Nocardioides bruguierae]|uniref:HD domain-containing protein n=1 Tax=Nocardioides bruguierae TaxID=2945102 RepID=UPI002020BCE8|nr:hypothetical protein [Nocardioides bruguierae]MCL8024163.1 hypothetical protein [Nocardioides bruguierae]
MPDERTSADADHPDPRRWWPLPDAEDLRERLVDAWSEPHRGYHDLTHLAEVLARLEELAVAGVPFPVLPVVLAAWFHDAVYDGERDAEERSAVWAEVELPAVVGEETAAEVARLVRLTETHTPEDDDVAGCALSDADLAILAAPAWRYEEYVRTVRAEYAHLDDATFHAGRVHVLEHLAEKPALFHTRPAREQWEEQARANLAAEVGRLRAALEADQAADQPTEQPA